MKKINRLVLRNAKTLTFPEMKKIFGGCSGDCSCGCYDGGATTQEEYCCALLEIASQLGGVPSDSIYGWHYGWTHYCLDFNVTVC